MNKNKNCIDKSFIINTALGNKSNTCRVKGDQRRSPKYHHHGINAPDCLWCARSSGVLMHCSFVTSNMGNSFTAHSNLNQIRLSLRQNPDQSPPVTPVL